MSLTVGLAACALVSPSPNGQTPLPTLGATPAPPSSPAVEATNPAALTPAAATSAPVVPTAPLLSIGFVGRMTSASPGSVVALSLQGAQVAAAAQSASLDVVNIDDLNPADPAAAIRLAADRGPALLVVAGSDLAEAARSTAQAYPALKFIGIDQPAVDSLPNYFTLGAPGNRFDEEGFLAGALAGLVTQERVVGVVVVGGTLESRLYKNGYLHGMRYTCGDCELKVVELDSADDTGAGAGAATRLKNSGADVIFAPAGTAGESGLDAAAAQGTWVIGLGRDRTAALQGSALVLGSVVRRPDLSVPALVAALLAGQTPPHIAFTLMTNNLSLADNFGPAVSPAVQRVMSDIITRLASGALDTGVDLTTGEEK